jgi:transglutaminase-like putative cysteine protease
MSYASASFTTGRPLLEAVCDLTRRIYTDFTYDPKATSVSTPLSDVLRDRHGVCQDFAHLQIGCLRALGLAARYVSGYLVTQPSPGHAPLVGVQASHAWVSVYGPGCGWIDLDPTNNVLPSDRHITVAIGRDYGDVSPINGVFLGGGEHTMDVAVDVVPVGA